MKIKPGDSRGRIKTNHTQKFCKENEHCILPKAFTHDVSSMEYSLTFHCAVSINDMAIFLVLEKLYKGDFCARIYTTRIDLK